MTEQEIVDKYLIFKAIRGSKAYGTNIEGSDEDVVGIYIQPDSDLTGLNYVPQVSLDNGNAVYYELRRFFELAMQGNPNILEIFNLPEDCVLKLKPPFRTLQSSMYMFLTQNLFNSFANYARSQIKKARGFNKKMNWDQNKVARKDVLDFCYVITRREESTPFKQWTWKFTNQYEEVLEFKILQEKIGLAKVNNIPDLYSMYSMEGGGIISENSNDVQLRSIPKDADHLGYLRFDKNAYSMHCKDYREYTDWVDKRNKLRYTMNLDHGKGYDAKNMLHCIRLINTAIDIAEKKEIVVRRPPKEVEILLSIRRGEMEYDDLLKMADEKLLIAERAFAESDLAVEVDKQTVHDLINTIRLLYKKYGI